MNLKPVLKIQSSINLPKYETNLFKESYYWYVKYIFQLFFLHVNTCSTMLIVNIVFHFRAENMAKTACEITQAIGLVEQLKDIVQEFPLSEEPILKKRKLAVEGEEWLSPDNQHMEEQEHLRTCPEDQYAKVLDVVNELFQKLQNCLNLIKSESISKNGDGVFLDVQPSLGGVKVEINDEELAWLNNDDNTEGIIDQALQFVQKKSYTLRLNTKFYGLN